jgi:hypothetical protein
VTTTKTARSGGIVVCAILFMAVNFSSAQKPCSDAEIMALVSSLSNHSVSPENALDPAVTGERPMSELKLFGAPAQ